MFDLQTFTLYFTAAFILAITPGPGMFYVLTRSIKGGQREGYASSFGTAIGGLFHVFAAALGISAILATSALAFNLIKYLGAAYLVFLGIRMLLKEEAFELADDVATTSNYHRAVRQGIVTEMLNPKTALFFLAFIPQFIDPTGSVVLQFILLGSLSVFLNTSADIVVATLAGPIASQMRKRASLRRAQRVFSGSGLIALGAYVAFSGSEASSTSG
jgi:threonine/homoserine/homoserine lactone efflux protein